MPLPNIKPLAKEESESLMFKALELLNRTNSAAMGLAYETIQGGNIGAAVSGSLAGEKQYGGQDVMSALLGGSPDDPTNRRLGLAADILNPLDPLNYVGGLGALTKTGKLAKLGKGIEGAAQLAEGAAKQTKAGQRALLSFGGQRVPLPGDAAILGALERGGKAFKESKPGRGLAGLFGGRDAAFGAAMADELKKGGIRSQHDLEVYLGAQSRATRAAETYKSSTQQFLDDVRLNLKKEDWEGFDEFLDQAGKGPAALMQDAVRFIGSGPGADRRRKAVESAQKFFEAHGRQASELLGNEGIGGMASTQVGYVPRMYRIKDGGEYIPTLEQAKTGIPARDALEGAANNSLNRSLIPGSEEPVSRQMLTRAGQLELDRLGPDALDKMRRENPKAYAEWHQRFRLPMADAIKALEGQGITLEQRPWVMLRHIQEQTARKIRADKLIENLRDAKTLDGNPIVKKWDELTKEEAADYIKINQGRYHSAPLAVPKIYDEALTRFNEVFMPGPDKPLLGEVMNAVLPNALRDAGLMSWWKGLAIYPLGPLGAPAYWSRNFASGMLKNRLEGMDAGDMARLLPEAARVVGQSLKSRLDPSAVWAKGDFVTKQGVPISREWLMKQYWTRNFHGGGSAGGATSEILGEMDSISSAARERIFGKLHKGNFRVEMMLRLPLMMKYIEDTLDVAKAAGRQLPPAIGRDFAETTGDIVDVALTNAREAVIRAHFDYEDLTPFEKKIRGRWIPFYCVPIDHEILTRRGWKKYDELYVGEEIFSMNHDTGNASWEPLEEIAVFDYDGDLTRIGMKGDRVEFLCTSDHRWPIKVNSTFVKGKRYGGQRKILRTHSLNTSHQIPRTAEYHGEDSFFDERLAAILGWIVTDGYHRWRGNYMEAIIYQSPKKHLKRIIELTGTKPRKPHPQTGVVAVPVAKEDVKAIARYFRDKPDLLNIVPRLSRKAAESMFEAMMQAEGSSGNGADHFAQDGPDSAPVLEAFQILCSMTGRYANLGGRGCYVGRKKWFGWAHRSGAKEKYYKGKIWCPKTRYGTWLMRHDGAVIWTGNTWMRKNIPHEAVNMVQQPGKYMPFARAYYNAYEQQQIAPEDLPQWAARSFAMPISRSEGDRARWLDWTGFLPFMDVAELGNVAAVATGLAQPEMGRTRAAEVVRYLATRGNPFIGKAAEQGLQKSFFTGRSFSGDTPMDVAGVTVGAPTRNLMELFPPVMAADRLNPANIFGESPRPHRNEPSQALRIMRTLTGTKVYATDKDEASLSYRAKQRKIAQLRNAERRELRSGNVDGAAFIKSRREQLERGR